MGGLVAARVLSKVFDRVTLVERDVLDDSANPRRGVPQGRHAHGLLARGREVLEDFFPGLTEELVGLGAGRTDLQSGFRWINAGRLLSPEDSGLVGLGVSRPLLESRVRARVLALPNVTLLDGCDATGLTSTADRSRVTGLRVLRRTAGGGEEVLDADLVVDASGRGSRGPQWLQSLGYPAPEVEKVQIGLSYASRWYRRDPDGPVGAAVGATTANPRGGVMINQEGDRWMVSIGGILGDAAPLDHEGFTAFAATLPSPAIHEVIRDAEPLTDAVRFRYPASSRRRHSMARRRSPSDARSHEANVRCANDSSSSGPIDFTRSHQSATVSGGAGPMPLASGSRAASANSRSSDCCHSAPPIHRAKRSSPSRSNRITRHRFGPSIAGETTRSCATSEAYHTPPFRSRYSTGGSARARDDVPGMLNRVRKARAERKPALTRTSPEPWSPVIRPESPLWVPSQSG